MTSYRRSHAAALAGATLALVMAPTGHAQDTAEVLERIREDFVAQRATFDEHRREFELVRRRAAEVKVDLRIARDPRLRLERAPSAFGPLDSDAMLAYLPVELLRDLRRRLAIEYLRGHDEWLAGYWPPLEYQAHDARTIRWTRQIFGEWDRDVAVFGLPFTLQSLHVEEAGLQGDQADFAALAARLPELRSTAEEALDAVEDFEPEVKWGWTWYPPFRRQRLTNDHEWEPLRRRAEQATNAYRDALVRMRASADRHVRTRVEAAVEYDAGDRPALGFLPGVSSLPWTTGWGYRRAGRSPFDALWEYWFDEQVLRALPGSYWAPLRHRLIQAYFLGARDAKHDRRVRVGVSGPYGTGDGYGLGGNERYRSGTGRRRPGAWDQGTGSGGTGTGGTGTGTGGTGSGLDHGTPGLEPGWDDLFGTGSLGGTGSGGTGSGGTGSGGTGGGGTGSGSGSGTSGTGTFGTGN